MVYIYEGQRYETMEEVRAAMSGTAPPAPSPEEVSQVMADGGFSSKIAELFAEYAGEDSVLAFPEMLGLCGSLCASLGIDVDSLGDLQYLFARYDFSKDGALQLPEATAMVEAIIEKYREQQVSGGEPEGPSFGEGDAAEMRASGGWIPCNITAVREDGAVQADLTGEYWWVPSLVKLKLRPAGGSAALVQTDAEIGDAEPLAEAPTAGEVRAIVMWNDFNWEPLASQGWGPLDTEQGGDIMKEVLASCGVQDVTEISRKDCTGQNVCNAIYSVGSRCAPDDTFIFYYTGHGDKLPDQNGDEQDGTDEAICTVRDGLCNQGTFLRDDDFAQMIQTYVKANNVVVLMDCCHSGTICDMNKNQWQGKNALSISGCQDAQVSAGTGQGGLLTHSLRAASQMVQGQENVSASLFYNCVVKAAAPLKAQFNSQQVITVQAPSGCNLNSMSWPLVPGA
eukprot:CAMPEP_0115079740 /NCGR_PEP_ID=MMETSP0227-20121206/18279_1 /TAXON_ID=89957 /ORGANISM="Polarella glacialis, Strain CCMP 1383" /LENGTH=451 /DNA_ID=CAMNT_0002467283 /DNA_START=38 /DNA_END=1393 /DNA_ORIENTATION=+